MQTLAPLFASLHLHHVVPGAFPPAVLGQAPVIEFATFFGAEPAFLANVQRFMEAVGEPDGVLGAAFGETVEADVVKHAEQGGEVEGGKAVVLLIGWTSKEMHMQFRETETFAKNIGLLREKCTGAEMVSDGVGVGRVNANWWCSSMLRSLRRRVKRLETCGFLPAYINRKLYSLIIDFPLKI